MEKTALKFILHYLKNFKYTLLGVFLLVVIACCLEQEGAYLLASAFNYAAVEPSTSDYWYNICLFLGGYCAFGFVGNVIKDISMWIGSRLMPHIRSVVIKDVFDYVNRHSISYFTNEMTGNISNKFNQLQNGVVEFLMQAFNAQMEVCFLVVNVAILLFLNRYIGIAMVMWGGIIFFVGRHFGRRRAALSKKTSTEQSFSNAAIVDSIANYAEIKSFSNYRYERSNLLKNLRRWRHTERYEQEQKVFINFYLFLAAFGMIVFFMALTGLLLYLKQINLTVFFYAINALHRLSGTVFGITWMSNQMSRIIGQMDSALTTLAVEPEITDDPQAIELKAKTAELDFKNVCFAYGNSPAVFENLNLHIKAGEKVGIVGSSGAGKSTLIKLIARYFDTCSGSINLNGTDIKKFSQDSLRRHISVIPQDVCLFNRSLFDNIHYGCISSTHADVLKAAKQASADKFVEKMPNGYDTKVGDRGVILSGGERQRIAIARALLKNAPILIFDEATSSLDSESERYIQESMHTLMRGKTVVAIAHRLSTLREMDRIIVLEDGKIVEEGTHLGLLRKKGRYAQLFKLQADGYIQTA